MAISFLGHLTRRLPERVAGQPPSSPRSYATASSTDVTLGLNPIITVAHDGRARRALFRCAINHLCFAASCVLRSPLRCLRGLSFDDGYLSQYTHAAKTLRPLGWPGVLFLKVDNIGPGGLTSYELKAMHAAGWELDAHTITHPDLTQIDATQLEQEVSGSRAAIAHRFGVPVNFFAYPSGRFNAAAKAAVRRAGFLAANTTQEGLAAPGLDSYALPRVRVNAGDNAQTVLEAIRSAPTTPVGAAGEF